MDSLGPTGVALLVGGGLVAGIVNTLAGGGSLLTVPLLVLVGLPGNLANGTNRIGILVQCLVGVWRFRANGFFELRTVTPVLVPVVIGAAIGALAITRVADETFELLFGALMLVLLVPTLRPLGRRGAAQAAGNGWGPATTAVVFFGVGLYGGAFQAGLGIPLLFALSYAGHDLVRANAIKLAVIAAVTLTAIPVFLWEGRIVWLPAMLLAAGYSVGGALGARIAMRGGERVIRPILALAVIALAVRMFGLL
jgi:uncharacterized membrane protein YfcA